MRIEKMTADFKLKQSRFKIRDSINHGNIIGKINVNCFFFALSDLFSKTIISFLTFETMKIVVTLSLIFVT